jgi:hypothetical protein
MRAPTALAALAAFAGLVLGPASVAVAAPAALPAPAALAAPSEVFIEVNPATIEAGERVGIRASCPDNDENATVSSDAFGQVTVEPRFGFLARSVTIPERLDARTFTVRLTCPGGQTATATLHVVRAERPAPTSTPRASPTPTPGPTRGPATGFGGTAGGGAGTALVAIGLLTVAAGIAVGLLTLGRRRAAG